RAADAGGRADPGPPARHVRDRRGCALALDGRRRRAGGRLDPGVAVIRAAIFDFGETLLSEERAWGVWAEWLGVTKQELFAALGWTIAERGQHGEGMVPLGCAVEA